MTTCHIQLRQPSHSTPLLTFGQNDQSKGKNEPIDDGWEYAPLFNLKFHAKERRMDLVRRRRWHRKLIAEDSTAPLVFNMGEAKQKMVCIFLILI